MRVKNSRTYCKPCCEGNVYITISRDDDGKIHSVLITPPSKSNDCGGSFAYALGDLLTFALRRAKDEEVNIVIKGLAGQHCCGIRPNKQHIRSCSDAIAQAIKEDYSKPMMALGDLGKPEFSEK